MVKRCLQLLFDLLSGREKREPSPREKKKNMCLCRKGHYTRKKLLVSFVSKHECVSTYVCDFFFEFKVLFSLLLLLCYRSVTSHGAALEFSCSFESVKQRCITVSRHRAFTFFLVLFYRGQLCVMTLAFMTLLLYLSSSYKYTHKQTIALLKHTLFFVGRCRNSL